MTVDRCGVDLEGRAVKRFSSVFVILTSVLGFSGCIPRSGPDSRTIESQATMRVGKPPSKSGVARVDYVLLDIDVNVLANVDEAAVKSLQGGFGRGRGSAPSLPLGVGDVVQVAVFESQAGGLFIPADAGSRPGNFVTLPQQTIDRVGTISVPYAGRVRAAGRTVDEVQSELQSILANRAIEPQVVVTKISSRSAQVAVLGDVNAPAKIELTEAGDRVLDIISQAGGLSSPGVETYVTLQRRGISATVLYSYLTETPAENIYVAPGDTILVDRERRTYLAFGASGANGRFDFEESDLTLGEALGKSGGLLDSRADPRKVFLYRLVNKKFLSKLGVNAQRFGGEMVPVIFKADLQDPSSFFLVQKFPMQDKDIIYVSNADSVELIKFLNIVNSVSSTVSGVSNDVVSTKDSIRDVN